MSISKQIQEALAHALQPVAIAELYAQISARRHSIRARLHEAVGAGAVQRMGRGLYIRPGAQIGLQADSREALQHLVDAGAKFDHIVLDLPYETAGQRGGNRHISRFPTVTPEEFGRICGLCSQLLRTETSTALFIFSQGSTSAKARQQYQAAIGAHLQPAGYGSYTKTDRSGKRVQMLGRIMPEEGLWLYSRSGKLPQGMEQILLDVSAVRPAPGAYPTEKPVELLSHVFSQVCQPGDLVLDPFAGSNATGEACAELGLSSLGIDIMHNPAEYRQARKGVAV